MRFKLKEVIDREICHFASPGQLITSLYNIVYIRRKGSEKSIEVPREGWERLFGRFRLARRALRLDKCNVVPVEGGLVIIRQGRVYHYSEETGKVESVLTLKNCRNVLHQSIAVIDKKELIFGEYGRNSARLEAPVYRSRDGGRHWETVFVFPAGKVRHVHGCYYDPYEKKIWTLTGDFDGECQMLCSDRDFSSQEWIGDGKQTYRACNLFFEEDYVHWMMDSQLETSYHIKFDRKSRTIERKQMLPGPVWYIKRLEDGYYLAATAQEDGDGVKDEFVHLMVSKDLEEWEDVYRFSHDGLPKKYFKSGVIGFPDGPQRSTSFYLFAEAIGGLDGKTALCEIDGEG